MTAPNGAIAEALAELAALLRTRKGERFRARAYDRAARVLLATPVDVAELSEAEVRQLDGIGSGIAGVIEEYLDSGHIRMLDELRAEEPAGFGALVRLPLIGVREARALAGEHGFTDLAELRAAAATPDGLAGVGERLAGRVRESLRRVDAVASEGLPLPLARREAAAMADALAAIEGVQEVIVAGAVRRGVDLVDDFDFVVIAEDCDRVAPLLPSSRAVVRVLDSAGATLRVATAAGRPATLWVASPNDVGAALLLATGDETFADAVRRRASEMGQELRPDGLYRGEDHVAAPTESAVLVQLGLTDVAPEQRTGDILDRDVPVPVTVADLRGDLHVHSDWSGDGRASMEVMVVEAAARGYSYVAITDHAENLTINGMTRDAVAARRRTVDTLRERYPDIRILEGCELNIGLDGDIDYDDEFLMAFDFNVASIHSHMDRPIEQQTDRILRAIEHPAVHVIGHPTGRIIGHRPPYGIDITAIAQVAAETGTALEVNGSPRRLDLSGWMVRAALAQGAVIAISSDAHSVPELGYVENAVPTARRGWATKADVVNCLPTDDFLAFVDRKKQRG